jgi:hypothetical protein
MATPDHSTINDFRSKRMKGILKDLFAQVVLFLNEEGVLHLKDSYTDGTKLEANANRYTFVWGRSIETNKRKIKAQLEEIFAYAQQIQSTEEEEVSVLDLEEISAEKVTAAIVQINGLLGEEKLPIKLKRKLDYAAKNWPERLKKYEEQQAILENRNSYSKTDNDATFMRTKEDHMKNGQLKPCYNYQCSTSEQYIINYTIGQNPSDTVLYKEHIENFKALYGFYPQTDTADAAYGSEENYKLLEDNDIEGYVKYSSFHAEQKKSYKLNPSKKDNLYYNEQTDCYYCPMGQKMEKIGEEKRATSSGFEQTISRYQAKNCEGCPMRGACHKSKNNRIVHRNHRLEAYKAQARQRLKSEKGIQHTKKRGAEVEAVFGQLKENKHFRRFLLRGKEKVENEIGLLAIAMNLNKFNKHLANNKGGVCPIQSKSNSNTQNKAQNEKKVA